MPLGRLETKVRGRGASSGGRSAPFAAGYLSGEEVYDEYRGKVCRGDVKREQRVVHADVMLPDNAPSWMTDRSKLWYAAELTEDAYNRKASCAIVAREWLISLPHEWSLEQKIDGTRRFIEKEALSRGLVADYAIHEPEQGQDDRNWHTHILIPTRSVDPEELHGFNARKAYEPGFNRQSLLDLRESWENHVNGLMKEWGYDERISMKSLKDQGIDRIPEPKIGPVANQMRKQGRESHAYNDVLAVRAHNDNRTRNPELAELRATHAKAVVNVADLADKKVAKMSDFELPHETEARRVEREERDSNPNDGFRDRVAGYEDREGKTVSDVMQPSIEKDLETQRAETAKGYDDLAKKQVNAIKEVEQVQSKVSPEEQLRRDYQANAEKGIKKAQAAEAEIKRMRERESANDDVANAGLRTEEAKSLVRSQGFFSQQMELVQKEANLAKREHLTLLDRAAKADTPEQAKILTMRAGIQWMEYHAGVDNRLAGIADHNAGNKESENGVALRKDADRDLKVATQLREERKDLVAQQRGKENATIAEGYNNVIENIKVNKTPRGMEPRPNDQPRTNNAPRHNDRPKDTRSESEKLQRTDRDGRAIDPGTSGPDKSRQPDGNGDFSSRPSAQNPKTSENAPGAGRPGAARGGGGGRPR